LHDVPHVKFDSVFLGSHLVHFQHKLFLLVRAGLILLLSVIDENFSPERVLADIDLFFRLEESLAGHLLLSTLLATLDNAFAFPVHSSNNVF
jgi:hypothetical protein